MKNNDVELIHRILDGDDTAFSQLVQRYQKQVHALAWRKIGDFQYCRRDNTGHLFKSISETRHTKKTPPILQDGYM